MILSRYLTDTANASTASDIQLGSCVTEIGQGAFSGYTNITDVEFPDSLTTIGAEAFSGSSVTSVEFPSGLTSIGASAFRMCNISEDINIPDSVTTIGNGAFYSSRGNKIDVTIGTGITFIGTSIFYSSKVNKLTINATTPPTLGNDSLNGDYLIYVPYSSYNDYITASRWVNYKNRIVYSDFPYKAMFLNAAGDSENFAPCNDSTTLTRDEINNTITTATTKVRFGNCVTTIGDGYISPFSGNSTINEVVFSDSITTIDNYAFQNTSGGIHISSFPSSITYFGNNAFSGNSSGRITIDNINLNGEYYVGSGAFSNCNIGNLYYNLSANTYNYGQGIFSGSNITSLTFGNDVTTIPSGMCSSGDGITALTIPSNITEVQYSAFERNKSIKNVVFQGNTNRTIGTYAFNRSVISSITIPNISSIGSYAFSNITGLTNFNASSSADAVVDCSVISSYSFENIQNGFETLEIGANVNEIQLGAFNGNNNLKKVHIIGNSSTTIPSQSSANGQFRYCTALTEVQIDNAASIGQYVFASSNAIEKVTINGGYPSIDNGVFSGKTSLSSVTLNGTTSIGQGTFSGCTSLTDLNLPSSLQSIGVQAFANCSGLQTLIIPDSVISIGNNAFSGCSGLNSILLGRSVPPTIGTNVFNGSSCFIYVPQASYDLYINAENWQAYRDRIFAVGSDYKAMLIGGNSRVINCNDNTTLSLSEVGSNNATTINIGNCVTEIGASAFTGSSSAQTISIPRSVTTIGTRAFYSGKTLTTVSGMEGVTAIDNWAFSYCSGLTSISFPDTLTAINESAFYRTNLQSVVIPSGVTIIGRQAFQSNSITSATFEGLTPPTIGDNTMTGYYSLFNKKIPIYVPCAAYNDYMTAWAGASTSSSDGRIIDYLVPSGQYTKDEEVVGEFICENGNKYKKVGHYVSSDNVNWCVQHYNTGDLISEGDSDCATYLHLEYLNYCGSECDTNGYTYTKYCYETTSSRVTYNDIPYAYNYVSAATIGDCVTEIDSSLFSGKYVLKSLTLGNNLTRIGDSAFYGCGFTSVNIPSGVTNIGYAAFSGCSSLTSITVQATTPPRLTKDVVYETYNSFDSTNNCPIYVPCGSVDAYKTATGWSNYSNRIRGIQPCVETYKVIVSYNDGTSYNVTCGGDTVVSNIPNVSSATSAVIGDCATEIGGNAFNFASELTAITIGNNVTTLGANAIRGTKITSIVLPNTLTTLGNSALENNSGLTSVNLPSGVTSIGNSCFSNCTSLSTVNIPSGVTRIGDYAFRNTVITSVDIPDATTSIKSNAFYSCRSLTSITIGSGITSIGDEAFNYCTSLVSITIRATTPPSISYNAFYNTNNCTIYVPSESVNTYKNATYWSNLSSRIQPIPNS